MGKVFLDTNCFIDTIVRKPEIKILDSLKDYVVYISTLSFHIYCYTYKIKMPDKKVLAQRGKFQLTDFSEDILDRALNGPTDDLEDNVQLHSAAEAECDLFLTNDKRLLGLKFFGKAQIIQKLAGF
ncbi:hypothetical protein A2W45_04110 [Candidatus Curtissbacteria bacterium RIFCSPHIGHO2_12_41_11]|uniref:PIN domain-containing protein n=2 Tax=Candidatus Curtissiibacteriota TaxID=1752717 RepID=A0A1F5H5T0_9BACT|nr:MAG: hypothetical protein A3D07_03925 [Candidatus Curtissbacteria bacterium RIFCSPHIGHO2_02_FULL_42_15]OGD99428.1 MAG: hypothetical protein A2W45_04110 [Candidatus Curtissbacteria bacterium RIFCSPHIGHO2_12_41_11]